MPRTWAGFFHINKRDKIYFTCTTRAPGFKAGMMTGTILGPEIYDDGSNAVVVSLQNCAAA
ncbi:hypothetical protein LJR290_007079 [Variovorax sp. LjRoot290]|uniref:hypothetical protein n=1 Tax=unclassified Variovorax TaxID=663243 RepID=UPI003ECDDE0F